MVRAGDEEGVKGRAAVEQNKSRKQRLVSRMEGIGNGLAAVGMLLKIADEDRLEGLHEMGDCSSLLEPLGYLVEMLAGEALKASDDVNGLF